MKSFLRNRNKKEQKIIVNNFSDTDDKIEIDNFQHYCKKEMITMDQV